MVSLVRIVKNPMNFGVTGRSKRLTGVAWAWPAVLLLLLVMRLPSLVQPAGGDQGLYVYAGQRVLAGDVMYRDMWDQKPPAIAFLYAGLWRIWPRESLVAGADLAAAVVVVWLLVVLGRRHLSVNAGYGAAAIYLLFGDPYLQRLSGIYVRGQCEPFIALAVTASLVLVSHPSRRPRHLAAAGAALAMAFWLKYNAAAYALPVGLGVWAWSRASARHWRATVTDLTWVGLGFMIVAAAVIGYFALNGALLDLRLATLDYNLRYSNETYDGKTTMLRYVVTFPFIRARVDMIWFLGGLGALLAARRATSDRSTLVILGWVAAAIVSIAINGSRSLPNYFVQAAPALALAASAGFAALRTYGAGVRWVVAMLLVAGFWRVGSDTPLWGMRLASLPGLVTNVRYDLRYIRGEMERDAYLSRFKGQKHDALENDRLVRYVRETTAGTEPIFVFGFSGGSVGWKSERRSSSRFFWSRPVLIEFAAEYPGYGSVGLLEDLTLRPPVIVALQKDEWTSREFFMRTDRLESWLLAGYDHQYETPMFSVWRRKP
jgi:hypothetical protein